VLDLDEELARGERVLVLPDLFEPTFAYRTFVAKRERDMAQQTAARRGDPVPAERLDEYAGRYRLSLPDQEAREFSFRRDGARLLLSSDTVRQVTGEDAIEIVPEFDDGFFVIWSTGTFAFRFTRSASGVVDGVVVRSEGGDYRAERLAD
jgi:hypothetical protein